MPDYVRGTCKKCKTNVRVPLNAKTIEMLQEDLRNARPYECPGQHVELNNMLDDYTWDWTPITMDDPMTDEEYGRSLIIEHGKDHVFYLGPDDVGKQLGIASLHTVPDLEHLGFGDFGNHQHVYVRHDSPCHTTRFYIRQ